MITYFTGYQSLGVNLTVIAAIRHKGKVLLGADSRVTYGDSRCEDTDDKIFVRHGITYAGAGDSLLLNQAQVMSVKRPSSKTDVRKWVLTHLVYEMREMVEELQRNCKETLDGILIASFGGYILTVTAHGDSHFVTREYTAHGTGGEFALGALSVLNLDKPEEAMTRAIAVAAMHCPTVGGPTRMVWAK